MLKCFYIILLFVFLNDSDPDSYTCTHCCGCSIKTLPFKSLDFSILLKEVSYAHRGCIYLIKKDSKTEKLSYCYNLTFKMSVISVMQSWIFIVTSVFSVKWSFRNHKSWFDLLSLLSMLKAVVLLNILRELW